MNDYYAHMDVAMKYAFLVLGKHIHEFFDLEGVYCYNMGTEVITPGKKNLRMDVVYYRSDNIINNIENQTTLVDEEKLKAIAEYAKFLLIYNSALVNSYVISKVDPEDCMKEIGLTETLMLRPGYLYKPEDELLQLLNTIKDKINSNKVLSSYQTSGLAMIPTLAQDNIAEEVTEDVCYLIEKDQTIDFDVKREICFIVDIMIDRNIADEKKKQELRKVLKMKEKRSSLEIFLEQQTKEKDDIIKNKDEELHNKDKELHNKDKELHSKDEELQNMCALIQSVKDILTNEDIDSNTKESVLNSLILFK